MIHKELKKVIKTFKDWSNDNAKYIKLASALNVAKKAYNDGAKRGAATLSKMIEQPKVNFLFEIYNNVLQFVNQNLGWDLPEHTSGAINLWFDDNDVMIDVETSDGGVSTISYTKFLEKLEEGKSKDPNYKLSKDDFCDCF